MWFFDLPLELRLAVLFVAGAGLGSLANLAIYRLAYHQRLISPWSPAANGSPPRKPADRLPVFGWLGLRREAVIHGCGCWIRPLLVELLAGAGLAWLYLWEIEQRGLLPEGMPAVLPTAVLLRMHIQFAVHAMLICLMLIGSLIDFDEKTIPDAITIPGTLLGLVAAAVYPWSLLPVAWFVPPAQRSLGFLTLTSESPLLWPQWMVGFPQSLSLAFGLGCWWLWCIALMHRTWYRRHGVRRAAQLMSERLRREFLTWRVWMGAIGSAAIAAVWYHNGLEWVGLQTALVGMVTAGGLIWLVRVISRAVLGREAMGFGDVTLMAMLGASLGWQSAIVIFFLAPVAGLAIGLIQLILRRENEIAYGPYLCLAAMVVLLGWSGVWGWLEPPLLLFGIWIVPVFAFVLLSLAPLLALVRLVRSAL